jgi:hypothetical protein
MYTANTAEKGSHDIRATNVIFKTAQTELSVIQSGHPEQKSHFRVNCASVKRKTFFA